MTVEQLIRKAKGGRHYFGVESVNRLSESEMIRLILAGQSIYPLIANPSEKINEVQKLSQILKEI